MKAFQTNKLVGLFLTDALQSILTTLMEIFIKLELLDAANCSENKLVKLDVSNLANEIPSGIMRLLTATETLKVYYIKISTRFNTKHQFEKECVAMFIAIVQKLQKPSEAPSSCLDLHRMAHRALVS